MNWNSLRGKQFTAQEAEELAKVLNPALVLSGYEIRRIAGIALPAAAATTDSICESCGVAVDSNRIEHHQEWHRLINESIREQVQEAIKDVEEFEEPAEIPLKDIKWIFGGNG